MLKLCEMTLKRGLKGNQQKKFKAMCFFGQREKSVKRSAPKNLNVFSPSVNVGFGR